MYKYIYAYTYAQIHIKLYTATYVYTCRIYVITSSLLEKRKEVLKSAYLLLLVLQAHLSSSLCLLNVRTNQVTLFDT